MTESVGNRSLDSDSIAKTKQELGAVFMDYKVSSSRILRDNQGHSRGVGFAR